MNRYLLAALYVMAGCAVTIPLKAQECGELLRVDRCRPMITNTLKEVISDIEDEACEIISGNVSSDSFHPVLTAYSPQLWGDDAVCVRIGSLCRTAHKIRAPEL